MTFIIITMAALSGWGIRKAAVDILRERKRERTRAFQAAQSREKARERARREAAWENIKRTKPNEETRIVPVFVRAVNK